MRAAWLFLIAAIAATASNGPSLAQPQTRALVQWDDLNGTWQGQLTPVEGDGLSQPGGPYPPMRIVIQGDTARVIAQIPGQPDDEVRPGSFRVHRLGTNAVISSIAADTARPQGWVETWAFMVTLKDNDTLTVNFVRVVNNNDFPPSDPTGRFSMMLTGEFQRQRADVR